MTGERACELTVRVQGVRLGALAAGERQASPGPGVQAADADGDQTLAGPRSRG